MSFSVKDRIPNIAIIESSFDVIAVVPVLLLTFREYISIGEDIEILTGRKYYLFTLAERIFEIFEFKFLKKLDK